MKRTIFMLATLGATGALFAACGDDDTSRVPTTSPTTDTASGTSKSTSQGEATHPDSVRVAVPVIDSALVSALGGDVSALQKQLKFHPVACSTDGDGPIPAPPKCVAGEPPGTPVQVLLIGTGQAAYRRSDAMSETLRTWLGSSRHVYAVKQLTSPDQTTGAKYVIVFVTDTGQGNTLALSDAGIVQTSFDPSRDPKRQADGPGGTFILAPK